MERVARRDDGAALAELMRRWEPTIRNHCHRILGESHLAKDAAQESFTKIFFKRQEFKLGCKFSTFLWRVSTNHCLDQLRRRRRRGEVAEHGGFEGEESRNEWAETIASPDLDPSQSAEQSELAENVQTAIGRLPEALRMVVLLKHYESLTFREVAEVLEIPEGTAKSRMADALALLRKSLLNEQSTEKTKCKTEAGPTQTRQVG